MPVAFICTTNDREFGPKQDGSGWEMLSSSLRKELGPEFEYLLAKPGPSAAGEGKTDWYVDLDATPVRISKLSPADRAAVVARLEGMRRQVLAYADRLAAPNARNRSQGMAADLRSAMQVPRSEDNQYVWSVNGQPILVAWGLEPSRVGRDEGAAPGELIDDPSSPPLAGETDPVIPGAAEVTGPVARPNPVPDRLARFPWALPLWLLFVALVGTSYFLLLQGCAFSSNGAGAWLAQIMPNSCSANAAPLRLITERERRDYLIARIRDAELDATRLRMSCSSGTSKVPQQESQKRACNDARKRLQDNHAQIGAMEVTLQWNGLEDLDLYVKCPPDGRRAAASPASTSAGTCESTADIDWNYNDKVSDHPIEHIVWKKNPPQGHYDVDVKYYDPKGPDHPVEFDVFVKRNGAVEGPFHGVVRTRYEDTLPYSFDVGPQDAAAKPQTTALPQCDAG